MSVHLSHPEILKRLKRARGHLDKVIQMIEDGEPCLKVAQQFQAVASAVANSKRVFIQDHLENCIEALVPSKPENKKKLLEFKEITKYF